MTTATRHIDQLRAALNYSVGKSQREIADLLARQITAAKAARDAATARAIARQPRPKRFCAWCGDDMGDDTPGDFCSENCASDDAADAAASPRG